MLTTWTMAILKKVFLFTMLVTILPGFRVATGCRSSSDCIGINKMCKTNTCECRDGYTTNADGTCIDKKCNIPGCVTCLNELSCKRCVKYILLNQRRCSDECLSEPYVILNGTYEGRVCEDSIKKDKKSIYMTLVAVFSTFILIVLISISGFLFIRRRKFHLMEANRRRDLEENYQMTKRHKPSIRQILGEYNEPEIMQQGSGTEEDFERLIQSLKEDAQLFLNMINEVKRKLNILNDKDTDQGRQYKSLIRDLSRVLRILNASFTKLEMPSDGLPLLLWAENALKRFECVEQQNPIRRKEKLSLGESSTNVNIKDALL